MELKLKLNVPILMSAWPARALLLNLCVPFLLLGCGSSDGEFNLASPPVSEDPVVEEPVVEPVVEDLCVIPEEDVEVHVTGEGIEYVRTPDACFEDLDAYPFEPNYVKVAGMRYHYVDEGPRDGEVVLMLHGQPSWSYLYREMIPVFVEAGYRAIALDHIGMGRSDKPVDPRVHQYETHVDWLKKFINKLGLSDITLFVQDWGSLMGLRVAGDNPELFARIVVANGDMPVIPPGLNPFSLPVFEFDESVPATLEFFMNRSPGRIAGFQEWIEFAASASHLFAADVVEMGTLTELSDKEFASYNAPFPSPLYWGAIRAFPSMISGITNQNQAAFDALGRFDRPFLFFGGEFDPNLGSVANQTKWIDHVPGSTGWEHRRYPAGHFIQDDVGVEMAGYVAEVMERTPVPERGILYNFRYCEILLLDIVDGEPLADIWGTPGVNRCPQELWDALDEDTIAAETGALEVGMNGVRFFVVDGIEQLGDELSDNPPEGVGESRFFGDLEMRLLTTVVPPGGGTERESYAIARVNRSNVWHFNAGRRVYELSDPEGTRYVMQSFSQRVDRELQLHDLVRLGERLELPEGWSYSSSSCITSAMPSMVDTERGSSRM